MIFNRTDVLLSNLDGTHIQWKWDPQDVNPSSVELEVTRSGSPLGPFDVISVVDPRYVFSYFDALSPRRPSVETIYYKLRAVSRSTGSLIGESTPFSGAEQYSKDALWIIEQQRILLEGVNGQKPIKGIPGLATIYKARNFGVSCPVCRDPVTGRVNISNCSSCHGTGKLDGYYNPILVGMNIQPYDVALSLTNLQKTEDNDTTGSMNNYPIMYPGDIVVEPSEIHWRVVRIQLRERYRVTVRQILYLNQLKPDEIENRNLRHVLNGGKLV